MMHTIAVYSKTALAVYKRRRFHMGLMTRIQLVNPILTKGKTIEKQGKTRFMSYFLIP